MWGPEVVAGEADAAHEVEEEGEEVEDGQRQADAPEVARAVHVPQPACRAPAAQSQVTSQYCTVPQSVQCSTGQDSSALHNSIVEYSTVRYSTMQYRSDSRFIEPQGPQGGVIQAPRERGS